MCRAAAYPAMTDPLDAPSGETVGRVRGVVGLAGLYGGVGVGVLLRLTDGGFAGQVLVPMVVLQVAMAPIAGVAGYVSYRGRPRLVPVVGLATLGGAALTTIGFVVVTVADPSGSDLVSAVGLVCGFLVGFVTSWTTLGFVAGTAARWRRRDTVSWQQLETACLGVIVGGLVVGVTYMFLVDVLSGLGDQLA